MDPTQGAGLDFSKSTAVVCKCGNHTFVHAAFVRHVSEIVSPTGKAGYIPMPTLVCNACGVVPDELIPSFMREGTPTVNKPKLTLVP